MEKNTIKAIIVDLGGVVFENGTQVTIGFLHRKYDIDIQTLKNIFYGELSWELRKGKIKYREFWDNIYGLYPSVTQKFNREVESFWHHSYTEKPLILDVLRNLKKLFCVGTISGNIRERIQFLEKKYQLSTLFDFAIYSFDFAEDKLNDKLYSQAVFELNKKGISPEESLYVDDNLDCLEKASQFGLNTHLFKDVDNFVLEIRKHGVFLEKILEKG